MSIYDKNFEVGFKSFSWEWLKYIIVVLIVLIIIWVLYGAFLSVQTALGPKVLNVTLEKNPITNQDQTKMIVIVKNNTEEIANNVRVGVKTVDNQLNISPTHQDITVLGPNETRQLTYLINPVGTLSPGDYMITVSARLNEKISEEKVLLKIEK